MTKVRLRGPPLNFSKAYQNLPWLCRCSNTQTPSACSADSSSSTTATTLNTPVSLPCTTCPLPLQRSAGGLRVRKPLTRSAGRRRCCAACNPVLQWLALWRHTVRGWGQNRAKGGGRGRESEASGPAQPGGWVSCYSLWRQNRHKRLVLQPMGPGVRNDEALEGEVEAFKGFARPSTPGFLAMCSAVLD